MSSDRKGRATGIGPTTGRMDSNHSAACSKASCDKRRNPRTARHWAARTTLPTDDATWDRARGWAVSQAIAALSYYTPQNNAALYHEAEAWLALVLSEGEAV